VADLSLIVFAVEYIGTSRRLLRWHETIRIRVEQIQCCCFYPCPVCSRYHVSKKQYERLWRNSSRGPRGEPFVQRSWMTELLRKLDCSLHDGIRKGLSPVESLMCVWVRGGKCPWVLLLFLEFRWCQRSKGEERPRGQWRRSRDKYSRCPEEQYFQANWTDRSFSDRFQRVLIFVNPRQEKGTLHPQDPNSHVRLKNSGTLFLSYTYRTAMYKTPSLF